jgi:haloacid dehalogenase superfamily, subfamily IA, variant 3 with third motif having DD or ED/haloacid dehalogenase superfamily, subfamily IA, variant 1 with third motif having Dx(3-4)D or Dx(3-4)E
MRWAPEPDLLDAGHAAGFDALGRELVPAMTERFREAYLPAFFAPGLVEEVEYPGQVRRLLGEFEIAVSDEELALFLEAEHTAWGPARQLAATTHALLESLRERGLKLGLVSNAFDPPDLLHRDLAQFGIAERVDFALFSSEVGRRKPDPEIFQRALDEAGVDAAEALFVGDTLASDIAGATALGLRTCQALWFRADDDPDGPEPDFQAFTQMDVLTIARRLQG